MAVSSNANPRLAPHLIENTGAVTDIQCNRSLNDAIALPITRNAVTYDFRTRFDNRDILQYVKPVELEVAASLKSVA